MKPCQQRRSEKWGSELVGSIAVQSGGLEIWPRNSDEEDICMFVLELNLWRPSLLYKGLCIECPLRNSVPCTG